MEPTLEAALARIFVGLPVGPPGQPSAAAPAAPGGGAAAGSTPALSGPGGSSARIAALAAEASARYERAQTALRAGDFAAYGRACALHAGVRIRRRAGG